jgi:hypothetical protein
MREPKVLGLEGSISGKLVSGSLERHGAIDQNVGAVGDLAGSPQRHVRR